MHFVATVLAAVSMSAAPAQQTCNTHACERRVERKHMREFVRPYLPWLERLEWCESRSKNIWNNGGSGAAGWHQFKKGTWVSVGGSPNDYNDAGKVPALKVTKLESRYRAVKLRLKIGVGQWACQVGT